MLIILAILVTVAMVLIRELWANDCHPCGISSGHYGDPGRRKLAHWHKDCQCEGKSHNAACIWNMSGFFGRAEIKPVSLYFGSSVFG